MTLAEIEKMFGMPATLLAKSAADTKYLENIISIAYNAGQVDAYHETHIIYNQMLRRQPIYTGGKQ